MDNETRKLMKLLRLSPDQIYHVFCLAICMVYVDGKITPEEGESLTRIGFGLGLGPDDISVMQDNALGAIRDTSPTDVIAYSLASLKSSLDPDQMDGVKQVLRYVAGTDRTFDTAETALLELVNEIWKD